MKTFLIFKYSSLMIFIILMTGCQSPDKLSPASGYIEVTGGKVWYKIIGDGDKTPLLLLHGGPGVPSYYLNPLSQLSIDRPVIYFDQLGCGRSDRITDTTLMTIERFVEEVEQVRQYLGLKEFYLYGQSWGTILGLEYYLAHPGGIKGLIFSSPAISIPRWIKDADTLIATLPDSIQQAIHTNEEAKNYSDPGYRHAVDVYYQQFLSRRLPWSADLDSTFSQIGENIYNYMRGPSEFTMTGTLKGYDRTDRLHEIKIPTLFIGGEFDEARSSTVDYYRSFVPGAKYVIIENAGNLTMQDNPDQNLSAIRHFLQGIEYK